MSTNRNPPSPIRLGFGCSSPWGEKWFPQEKAIALIEQAILRGISFFDTGTFYCRGEAERRLGRALHQTDVSRGDIMLSTKTGTRLIGKKYIKDFNKQTIEQDIETSLERLQTDYLDIVYLHGPVEQDILPALSYLAPFQKQGVIRKIGLCSDHPKLQKWASYEGFDALMAPFNFLNQTFLPTFTEAKQAGKHTAAIAPLAQGLYRKGFFFPKSLPDFWYIARARMKNQQTLNQAQKLSWLHNVNDWQANEIALAFVLVHPCFDTAITTTTRPDHLEANCTAASRELPAEIIDKLKAL